MMEDNRVEAALVKYSHAEVSNQQLAEHMGFSSEEQRMLAVFWEPAFNGSWIYLSDEMITKEMGYKQISAFYRDTLRPNYAENIDYIEITKTDDLIKKYEEYKKSFAGEISPAKNKDKRGGSNIKYYKITGRTLKKMLMICGSQSRS